METITNVMLHNTQNKQVFYGDKIKDKVIGWVCNRQEEHFQGQIKGKNQVSDVDVAGNVILKRIYRNGVLDYEMDSIESCYIPVTIQRKK